jgi:uncharacterized protein (DUF305 family)
MRVTRYLLPALAGLLLLAGCGADETTTSPGANPIDRAFVAEMIPHHEAAVAMAKIAERRGSSAFVKQLAAEIARTQAIEIATMRTRDAELAGQGIERGSLGLSQQAMGMDHDVGSLEAAKPFDDAFLRLMIPHHEGALVMSNALLKDGADPQLKTLARAIITSQQREIAQMREQLGDGGAGEMHGGEAMPEHSR